MLEFPSDDGVAGVQDGADHLAGAAVDGYHLVLCRVGDGVAVDRRARAQTLGANEHRAERSLTEAQQAAREGGAFDALQAAPHDGKAGVPVLGDALLLAEQGDFPDIEAVVMDLLDWQHGTFRLSASPSRRRDVDLALPITHLLLEQATLAVGGTLEDPLSVVGPGSVGQASSQ